MKEEDEFNKIKEEDFEVRNDFLVAKGETYMKPTELFEYKKHREEVVKRNMTDS